MSDREESGVIGMRAAQAITGLNHHQILRLVEKGVFPVMVDEHGMRMFSRAALERWTQTREGV